MFLAVIFITIKNGSKNVQLQTQSIILLDSRSKNLEVATAVVP
jgi:hypothetical protein